MTKALLSNTERAFGRTTRSRDTHGVNANQCHLNGIELVFSALTNNNIIKVTRGGQMVWVLGGSTSDFTGEGSSWNAQHGINVLADDRILFFNNGGLEGGGGRGGDSLALEVQLDTDAKNAAIEWQYDGGIYNQIMGDMQRLWNGNTIVAYSTQSVLHEVDAEGKLVQELKNHARTVG